MECIFCKIIKKEIPAYIVWENHNSLAFLDINPIKPGHILLIPKIHCEDIFEMNEEAYQQLLATAKQLIPHLKKATSAKRIGMIVEGFGVAHAHIHFVPVNFGNELNPELAHTALPDELEKMHTLLKEAL
jgi:histidine triad (HIT) family protein